jgi:protein-S-isoprenylcysteine O-methyltransferase Ste14
LDFFDWFQVAGLGLFIGMAMGRTVATRIRHRVNTFLPGRSSRLALLLFILTNVWAFEGLFFVLPVGFRIFPSHLHITLVDWLPLKIAGAALVVAGFCFNIAAHLALGESWRLGIDENRPGRLVTTGIYRFTRNPIYLFFGLYFFGTFLINGTLFFLGFLVLGAVLLHLLTLQEERFLARVHGPAFAEYRQRTPRYIGVAHL